jgi:hypothetical protein
MNAGREPDMAAAWRQAAVQGDNDWAEYLRQVYYLAGSLWVLGLGEQVIAALGDVVGRLEGATAAENRDQLGI